MTDPTAAFVVASVLADLLGGLPPEVQRTIRSLPAPNSPLGAAVYGAGGIFGGFGIKRVIGRVRGGGGSPSRVSGTTVSTSSSGESGGGEVPESVKHDEAAFTLPAALPLSKGIRKVTHNEIHALELGVVVGIVTVWLYSIGRHNAAGGIAVAFVAGGMGFRHYKSKAVATVRMEPWYAFLAFALGGAGAYLFFVGP